jgi:hypothetical protein
MERTTIREAVGIFDNIPALNAAVEELESTAFPRHDISVLGSRKDVEEEFGSAPVNADYLKDNPAAPRAILVRPEEKVIGASAMIGGGIYAGAVTGALLAGPLSIASTLAMIVPGAVFGGMLGAAAAWLLEGRYNKYLETQIKKGGLLLWVHTPNRASEKLAQDILHKHGGRRVHIHNIS